MKSNKLWGVGYITKDFDYGQSPILIHTFNEGVVSLVSGVFHCMVLTSSNKVYAYGQNGYKQVGVSTGASIKKFEQINVPTQGARIESIAAGYHHSLVLTENNKLIVWGAQSHGQLSVGTKTAMLTPTVVNSPLKFSNLYLAKKSNSFAPLVEAETVEIVSPTLSRDDKDRIIREQASKIAILEAEIQSLKLQVSYQNNSRTLDDVGAMKVTFTK